MTKIVLLLLDSGSRRRKGHVDAGAAAADFCQRDVAGNQIRQVWLAEKALTGIDGGGHEDTQADQQGYQHQGVWFPEKTLSS